MSSRPRHRSRDCEVDGVIAAVGADVGVRPAAVADTSLVESVGNIHRLLRAAARAIELLIDVRAALHELLGLSDALVEGMELHRALTWGWQGRAWSITPVLAWTSLLCRLISIAGSSIGRLGYFTGVAAGDQIGRALDAIKIISFGPLDLGKIHFASALHRVEMCADSRCAALDLFGRAFCDCCIHTNLLVSATALSSSRTTLRRLSTSREPPRSGCRRVANVLYPKSMS